MRPTGIWMVSVDRDHAFWGQRLLQLGTRSGYSTAVSRVLCARVLFCAARLHASFDVSERVRFRRPPTGPFFGLSRSFGDGFRTNLCPRTSVARKLTLNCVRYGVFDQISPFFLRTTEPWSPKYHLCLKRLHGSGQNFCNLWTQLNFWASELFKSVHRLQKFCPFLDL